jgi:PAS domain S-box-containing protein
LLYGFAATIWILLSDQALTAIFSDPSSIYRLQTYKGLGFVAVTALLLYATLRSQLRHWEKEAEARRRAEHVLRREHEHFTKLASTVPGVIYSFRLRPDGTSCLPYANTRFKDLYGLRPEDLTEDASSLFALIHPDDVGRIHASIAGSARALSPWREEFRVEHPEKGCIWLEAHSMPERESDGSVVWNGFVQDITGRKGTENRLRRLATAVDHSGESIMITDVEANIQYVNPAFERLTGYSLDEVLGKNPRLLKSGKAGPEFYRDLWDTITRGSDWYGHFTNKKKDGTLFEEEATISPVRDGGRIVNYVAVKRDVTERKKAEQEIRQLNAGLEQRVAERTAELREAKERAESSDRAKSAFLSIMAHEFRTPLNAIIGFSELLVDDKAGAVNPQQREFLNDVLTSGRHLLTLINDVLDLTKIAAGKIELKPERFILNRAVTEAHAIVKELALSRRIATSIDTPRDDMVVTLDPLRFKQIIYNLLSNAVKFTPEGGKVEVAAWLDDRKQLHLQVKDTGIGIKKEDLPRLFREFEQIDSSFARRRQGTGLGLALTKKIVDLQRGSISVESEVQKGSTFTVILPSAEI